MVCPKAGIYVSVESYAGVVLCSRVGGVTRIARMRKIDPVAIVDQEQLLVRLKVSQSDFLAALQSLN